MNTRLELLSRKNKGKHLLKEHLSILRMLLGGELHENDFLPLEQSDAIRNSFFKKIKTFKKGDVGFLQKTFSSQKFDQDRFYIDYLSDFVDFKCYWITSHSEYYGVSLINLQNIKGKILDMIEFDGDSLNLVSQDFKKGLLLDYYEEDGEWFYELSTW